MRPWILMFLLFHVTTAFLSARTDTLKLTYEIGATELTDKHKSEVRAILEELSEADSIIISITGSADYLGNLDINQQISDKRVHNVVNYIQADSIRSLSFNIQSRGEVNSYLEESLGSVGVTEDRSVTLVFHPMYVKGITTEYRIEDIDKVQEGDALILEDLNFFPGRHRLIPASIPYLQKLLSALLDNPNVHFEIQGHICCLSDTPTTRDGTDVDTGKDELSMNRALNIYNYLVKNGVDSTKLSHKGYGFSQPLIFPEQTAEDRQLNRRVAIRVLRRN